MKIHLHRRKSLMKIWKKKIIQRFDALTTITMVEFVHPNWVFSSRWRTWWSICSIHSPEKRPSWLYFWIIWIKLNCGSVNDLSPSLLLQKLQFVLQSKFSPSNWKVQFHLTFSSGKRNWNERAQWMRTMDAFKEFVQCSYEGLTVRMYSSNHVCMFTSSQIVNCVSVFVNVKIIIVKCAIEREISIRKL